LGYFLIFVQAKQVLDGLPTRKETLYIKRSKKMSRKAS